MTIRDKNGRVIVTFDKKTGRSAFPRYTNMTDREKLIIIDLYKKISGKDNVEDFENFLNFKDDKDIFCT